LTTASSAGVWSPVTIAGAAITIGIAVTWFTTAMRRSEPFLDPRLYRQGIFGVLNAIVGLQMLILFGVFFAVPLMLVTEHGVSNGRAGAVMALTPLVSTVLAPFAGRLADRVGTRIPVVIGCALLCIAGAVLAGSVTAGVAVTVAGLLLAGAGISVIQSPVAAEVTRVVSQEGAGLAVGMFNAGRLISGSIGTAIFTLVFQFAASISPGENLDSVPPESLAGGFRAVFVGMSVAGALALVLAVVHGHRFWRPTRPSGRRSGGSRETR
jgi:MFS family permease